VADPAAYHRSEFQPASALDRDKLILDHLPLLKHIAGRMTLDTAGALDRDDIYGFGMVGLIQAADSWDPGRGLAFSTYAYSRIRGAILDELRRNDFLPRGRREKVRELEQAVQRLEQRHGMPPTPEEIALELGIALDEVDAVLVSAKAASCKSLDDERDSLDLGALLDDPSTEDPVGSAEWLETKRLLQQAIAALPEPEQTVITLYYAEELLLKEIGEVLGVTESRVSQVHTRALYRLNRALAGALGNPRGVT
jgi:RNA polymerase sigma factor for flagellar operon FliA